MCNSMRTSVLSKVLAENIRRIKNERESLFKKYFCENVEDSMEFEYLVKEYIETVKKHMKKRTNEEIDTNKFPFVLLWSIVEVQDMDDMETYRFLIIPPYSKNNDMNIDCVSMMSPLGKALLLKNIKQNVTVEVPQGTLNYKIKRVTIPA